MIGGYMRELLALSLLLFSISNICFAKTNISDLDRIIETAKKLGVEDTDHLSLTDYKGYFEYKTDPLNAIEIIVQGKKKYIAKVENDDYLPVLKNGQLLVLSKKQLFVIDQNTKVSIKYHSWRCGLFVRSISGDLLSNCTGFSSQDGGVSGYIARDLDGEIIRHNSNWYGDQGEEFLMKLAPGETVLGPLNKILASDSEVISVTHKNYEVIIDEPVDSYLNDEIKSAKKKSSLSKANNRQHKYIAPTPSPTYEVDTEVESEVTTVTSSSTPSVTVTRQNIFGYKKTDTVYGNTVRCSRTIFGHCH
jgi:hypothetical protein